MPGYWTQTRPNGKPIEAGTFCWVTEVEGCNPIYTYGETTEEVLEKVSRTMSNAQAALAQRSAPPAAPAAPLPQLEAPKRLSADEVMQATADLDNPAKAGAAAARLIEDNTGLDLRQLAIDAFDRTATQWEQSHPEFFPHRANKLLLAQRSIALAGGQIGRVTGTHLERAYLELKRDGTLVDAPASPAHLNPTEQPGTSTLPEEIPVQRTERPRQFATGTRSANFGQPPRVQPKTLKYTEAEVRSMSYEKRKALIDSDDPDFAAACEAYFGQTA